MQRFLIGLVVALALFGCEANTAKINVPELPKVELPSASLPTDVDGEPIVFETNDAKLQVDTGNRDALTALGACTDLVTYCVEPGVRSVDQCVASVPTCRTTSPWNELVACCPKSCQLAFNTARENGVGELRAFEDVFFGQSDCFPGVQAALRGEP
jgi:hypothetical protein